MLGFIRNRRLRNKARAAYWVDEDARCELDDNLADTADPWTRSKLLRKLSELEFRQSQRHPVAFGPDLFDDGTDVSDALLSTSKLYRVLADVEHVVACNGRVGRNWRFHELGPAADRVLDEMAATSDLAARRALLLDLAIAVEDHVGVDAAHMLSDLPSPGFAGWTTLGDREAAVARRRSA